MFSFLSPLCNEENIAQLFSNSSRYNIEKYRRRGFILSLVHWVRLDTALERVSTVNNYVKYLTHALKSSILTLRQIINIARKIVELHSYCIFNTTVEKSCWLYVPFCLFAERNIVSVFQQDHRTNNYAEAHHHQLHRLLGTRPNPWIFLSKMKEKYKHCHKYVAWNVIVFNITSIFTEGLLLEEKYHRTNYRRVLKDGHVIHWRKKQIYVRTDGAIRKLMTQHKEGSMDAVKKFLCTAKHYVIKKGIDYKSLIFEVCDIKSILLIQKEVHMKTSAPFSHYFPAKNVVNEYRITWTEARQEWPRNNTSTNALKNLVLFSKRRQLYEIIDS